MNCPYCGAKLQKICDDCFDCSNGECKGCYPLPLRFWQDLIAGKKAQSELNYYKGLNCPTVVEKQMQTITTCAKRLDIAAAALKEIANYKYTVGETDMKGHLHNLIKIARKALQDTKE